MVVADDAVAHDAAADDTTDDTADVAFVVGGVFAGGVVVASVCWCLLL